MFHIVLDSDTRFIDLWLIINLFLFKKYESKHSFTIIKQQFLFYFFVESYNSWLDENQSKKIKIIQSGTIRQTLVKSFLFGYHYFSNSSNYNKQMSRRYQIDHKIPFHGTDFSDICIALFSGQICKALQTHLQKAILFFVIFCELFNFSKH